MIWNGLLMDWARALATGLAQLAIWSTLLSLVPFVSLWANLKTGALIEMPQSTLRTHWTCSLTSAMKCLISWATMPFICYF